MNERKRIEWIDVAKGIGILLVIISHVEELKECIDKKIVLLKSTQGSSISWKE